MYTLKAAKEKVRKNNSNKVDGRTSCYKSKYGTIFERLVKVEQNMKGIQRSLNTGST